MTIYIMILLYVVVGAFLLDFFNIENSKIVVVLSFIPMYTLLAFRAPSVGADTVNYLTLFEEVKSYSFMNFEFSRMEPGYLFLNKILSFLENQQFFIILMYFIPIFLIFKFIYEESKIPWLSIFLFVAMGFYFDTFNILRQVIALGVITKSYKYLKEDNFMKFTVFVLLAASFHITALVFIPLYFVRYNKLSINNYIYYLIFSTLAFMLSQPILSILLSTFSELSYEIKHSGGEKLLFLLIMILLIALKFKDKILKKDEKLIILYNIINLGILIQLMSLRFSLFTRVGLYFRLFAILLIPEVVHSIEDKRLRKISEKIILVIFSIYFIVFLLKDWAKVVPYIPYWQ